MATVLLVAKHFYSRREFVVFLSLHTSKSDLKVIKVRKQQFCNQLSHSIDY